METIHTVVDTNVLLSGLRSTLGTSHRLLREIGRNPSLLIHLSVPLVLEYEEVLKRQSRVLGLTYQDIGDVLDFLCSVATHHQVFYLWRPFLLDMKDDMLLELAVEARCSQIVTFNVKDFRGSEQFGIRSVTPKSLLKELGVIK